MNVNNILTVKNKKRNYVQSGGFIAIIAIIGEFLLKIVIYIIKLIIMLFKALFMIRWHNNSKLPSLDNGEGMFYKYAWVAAKCGIYLVIFAFGGPLITMIGIIFLYKKLFSKFNELKKIDVDPKPINNN